MAGSSNFLQWNPAQNNMENDAAYLADSMRLNGATAQIYPSNLHNKAMYQQTTFTAAFAQMLADRGFSVSDASLSALTAVFDELVDKTGATMTGDLILNSDPTANLQAVTKQYVDNEVRGLKRSTAYAVGDVSYSNNTDSYIRLECTTAGTTASSEPTWTAVGTYVTDGSVVWLITDVRDARAARTISGAIQAFQVGNGLSGNDAVNFSQFTSSLIANGYQKFPGGLIWQWGGTVISSGTSSQNASCTFPIAFPSGCLHVYTTILGATVGNYTSQVTTKTLTGATFTCSGSNVSFDWMAIGY